MNATALTRSIGLKVRACRLAKGLSQKQLAAVAGVSERLVRSLEMGNARGIGLEKLAAVLTPLDLDLRLVAGEKPDDASLASTVRQSEEYSTLLAQAVATWAEGANGEAQDA